MALGTGSLYLLREAGALLNAGIAAGSVWPGGAYAANPPAMPNLPWRYVARNAPAPMPPIPTMSQSAPGRLSIAGWIADQEAGDAQSDAMWQAQRDADWASMHAGPPGTVVPPMPADFEPAPPNAQPAPFSPEYYAQLNAQNATAPPGTTVQSAPGGGTYYNPPAALPPPVMSVRPRIVPIPIGAPTSIAPVPVSQPPSTTVVINPPPAMREPPSVDTAPTPSGGAGGAGAPASATPWLVGGAIVLGLIYLGRKKKRGR